VVVMVGGADREVLEHAEVGRDDGDVVGLVVRDVRQLHVAAGHEDGGDVVVVLVVLGVLGVRDGQGPQAERHREGPKVVERRMDVQT